LACLSRAWLHRRSVGSTVDDQRLLSRSLSRDRQQREGKIQITLRTLPAQVTSGAPRGSVGGSGFARSRVIEPKSPDHRSASVVEGGTPTPWPISNCQLRMRGTAGKVRRS